MVISQCWDCSFQIGRVEHVSNQMTSVTFKKPILYSLAASVMWGVLSGSHRLYVCTILPQSEPEY